MTLGAAIVLVIAIGTVVVVTSNGDEDPGEEDVAIGTDTTEEAASTTEPSTTTTEPPEPDLPGEEFTDPEGVYTMQIDPAWHSEHGTLMQGMELWAVGSTSGDFPAIVNVVTALRGGDVSVVIDEAVQGLESAVGGLMLIDNGVREGALGQELGFVEYTGTQEGQPLHALQLYLVGDGAAVVATLGTTPETFADVRTAVEPYLLTLDFVECPTKQFSCVEDP